MEVRLRLEHGVAPYFKAHLPPGLLAEDDEPAGLVLTFLVPAFESLIPMILAYSTTVEVLEPPGLRVELHRILTAIQKKYSAAGC